MVSYIHYSFTQLYLTLILPLFTYCNYVYDGCSKTESNKLEVLQNNALRAVMSVDFRYSVINLHQELEIEWLDVTREQASICGLYKLISGHGPQHLTDMFRERGCVCTLQCFYSIVFTMCENCNGRERLCYKGHQILGISAKWIEIFTHRRSIQKGNLDQQLFWTCLTSWSADSRSSCNTITTPTSVSHLS